MPLSTPHFVAASFWYGFQGVPSFISPYLPIYFSQLGFSGAQIGLLSALRPWISAPFGSIAAAAADRLQQHRLVLLAAFLATTFLQGAMALFSSFSAQLGITILVSMVWVAPGIIGDAAVMAASEPGDYGRLRTWASVAWILFAPISGWVNQTLGLRAGIAVYFVGSLFAVPAAWMLPTEALMFKREGPAERVPEEAGMPVPELMEPLLPAHAAAPEGVPPAPPALARALAIVRFIEAITELGAVPPPGSIYGFAEVTTPYAATHFRPASSSARSRDLGRFLGDASASAPSSPFASASPAFGAARSAPVADQNGPSSTHAEGSQIGLPETLPGTEQTKDATASAMMTPAPSIALTIPNVKPRQAGQVHPARRVRRFFPRSGDDTDGGNTSSSSMDGSTPSSPISPRDVEPAATERQHEVDASAARLPYVFDQCLGDAVGNVDVTTSTLSDASSPLQKPPFALAPLRVHVPPPPRSGPSEMIHSVSATDLLREVREIADTGPHTTPKQEERGAEARNEVGLPRIPTDTTTSAALAQRPIAADAGERVVPADASSAPSTPGAPHRSSALHRLAQLFEGWGGGHRPTIEHASEEEQHGEEEEEGEGEGESEDLLEGKGRDVTDEGDQELSMHGPSSFPPPAGFSPVQRYLDYRRDRLAAKMERRRRRAAENQREFELEPPTPVAPPTAGVESSTHPEYEGIRATLQAMLYPPDLAQDYSRYAPVSVDAMRAALEHEAQELSHTDPTGSLVVDTLAKKLRRLAAEQKQEARRQARRKKRAEKEFDGAEATVASALPEAAEEGRAQTNVTAGLHDRALPESFPSEDVLMPSDVEVDKIVAGGGFGARMGVLFRDPSVLAFFLLATLLGFGHGVIGTFLFLYLKNLHAGESLMGWVLMANALPEMPVFYFFGAILHVVGMDTLLLLSTAGLGLRIAAYVLLPRFGSLLWILPLETLHALTYACGWSAGVINASKIAPPGLESTSQAIFQGLWNGVGAGLGGMLGGLLFHGAGAGMLFLVAGAVILVGTAIAAGTLSVTHVVRRRRRQKYMHNGAG